METTAERGEEDKLRRPSVLHLLAPAIDRKVFDQPEIIDLCTPYMDLTEAAPAMPVTTRPEGSSTERFPNLQQRRSILPMYPCSGNQEQGFLLLANLPRHQLTPEEGARRCSRAFRPAFDAFDHDTTVTSFLRDKYQRFFGDLIERLKVDMTILDFNYIRLNKYMRLLMDEQMRVFKLRPADVQLIHESEYPLALEFFLQFDVNLFYLKTCSFRFARPRTMNEGLFCAQEPEARYELASCGNCGLCYPQYDRSHRTNKSVVEYSEAHQHTFLNGYRAILNCSASCHTQNIIYALTCPCGKFDYVGATAHSLHDRLFKHREHGHRIMHEFLLGQDNIMRDMPRPKTYEVLRKDRMKLYQHSARCPAAMQIFLDANPRYWRFVPMLSEEADRPEQRSIQRPVFSDAHDWNLRSRADCQTCVETVPKPPAGYVFSNRQILLQTQYFHKKQDKTPPNDKIDLYQATVVAVLPETCSSMFRYTIESMFITHAETHLNTVGNVLHPTSDGEHHPIENPWLVRGDGWCQALLRRPQPPNTVVVVAAASSSST